MGCGCLALLFSMPLLAALMFYFGGEYGWMWFSIFLWFCGYGSDDDKEKTP
jgi:hypothetical protein